MATIREVAKRAGVSIATVSNVINAKDARMSEETRDKVLLAIRELRYRPTALEQDQKAIRTHNIGVILPDATARPISRSGYFREILDGLLEAAFFNRWSVTLFAQRTWDDVGNAVRHRYDGRCDGLILVAPQPETEMSEAMESLHKRGTPMVQIGTTPWLSDVSSVDLDNVAAGRLVAEHLIGLGHRRLGFVSWATIHVASHERMAGFFAVEGAESHTHFAAGEGADRNLATVAQQLLEMGSERPTAVLAWHDGTAVELTEELFKVGLCVPDDISVVGIDDAPEATMFRVPLTTVPNPLPELGNIATKLLVDQLDRDVPPTSVLLPPTLIVRESTAPPADLC